MSDRDVQDVNAVLDRLLRFYGVRRDTELAGHLGVARNTVSSWRSRGSIPYDVCRKVAERDHLSLDWILEGHGEPDLSMPGIREPSAEYLSPEQRAARALEIVIDVNEDLSLDLTKDGMKDHLKLVFDHSLTREGLKDVVRLQFKARNLEPPVDKSADDGGHRNA